MTLPKPSSVFDKMQAQYDAKCAEVESLRAERQQAQETIRMHDAQAATFLARAEQAEAERQQAQDKLWEQSEAAANLVTEVERLEAERRQAQEELERVKVRGEVPAQADYDAVVVERQQLQEERDQIARDYEWAWGQRQQAIDALRYIAQGGAVSSEQAALDVLGRLGEQ